MTGLQSLSRRRLLTGSAAAIAASAIPTSISRRIAARTPAAQLPALYEAGDLAKIAADAYVFAYPLILMDLTRQQMTSVPAPTRTMAPANQFVHGAAFPDASFESVVSANVDTLYSSAWLDLSREPVVLSLPDTGGRYYLMPIYDAWTNVFASPGPRTTGTGAGDYAIVGSQWKGQLPAGLNRFDSPTEMAWIIGRTQTNGTSDYDFVHSLQAQYKLTPLSAWGQEYAPPTDVAVAPGVDQVTAPKDQVAGMPAQTFWTRFTELTAGNPTAAADAPMVEQLAQLGIVPGQKLAWDQLPVEATDALAAGRDAGLKQIESAAKSPATEIKNGWAILYKNGVYGTHYLLRAGIAWVGLGANLPEDAIYPRTQVDSAGQPLDGANAYILHFTNEEIPPVNAFWSLTMYNSRQFLVKNPINRYAIGDRDELIYGADGSLEIYIQHESPGAVKKANWLPAPTDAFNLILRLYWPKQAALDGTWVPPAVTRSDAK